MSSQHHFSDFTLIVADSAKLTACQAFEAEVPSLARLAGRGTVHEVAVDSTQMTMTFAELSVLRHCGLLEVLDQFPSAALSAASMIDEQSRAFSADARFSWVRADAVHFSAGLSDIAGLQLRDGAKVTDEEHVALSETLQSHLASDCEVLSLRPGCWILKFARALSARTRAPQHAFRGPLQEALPIGPDGAQLRRLMTELQMVVHDDAVNRGRARKGLPAINAVWLWGLGAITAARAPVALPKAYGSSAYLRGLYSVHGTKVEASDATLERILSGRREQESILCVADEAEPRELESKWFEPLERALRAGRIKSLAIDFDYWRISVKRSQVLRFWRASWNPPVRAA